MKRRRQAAGICPLARLPLPGPAVEPTKIAGKPGGDGSRALVVSPPSDGGARSGHHGIGGVRPQRGRQPAVPPASAACGRRNRGAASATQKPRGPGTFACASAMCARTVSTRPTVFHRPESAVMAVVELIPSGLVAAMYRRRQAEYLLPRACAAPLVAHRRHSSRRLGRLTLAGCPNITLIASHRRMTDGVLVRFGAGPDVRARRDAA